MMRALLGVTALALLAVPVARADGDPASDVLYSQWIYVPYGTPLDSPQVKRLQDVVDEARRAKFPLKVAVIGSAVDLGSVQVLWRYPQRYAEFLGKELAFVYRGRLLTVMPNGFGLYDIGRGKAIPSPALRRLRVGSGRGAIVDAAARGVAAVANERHHPVRVPKLGGSSNTSARIRLALIGGGVVLALALVELARRRRRATA